MGISCHIFNEREELTTEGGLDVVSQISRMTDVCAQLKASDVIVSLFIDAQKDQIDEIFHLISSRLKPNKYRSGNN
jgi:pyridoxine 5-phosphate synthase